ncbi:MAG TPA: polyhydroxyalkanoate granule-associated phasin [Casimicrobiaceae bacterium]|nr:polyhydroxyalkanoate granule-associated phasin [Casimicrobiaceae bacterium]
MRHNRKPSRSNPAASWFQFTLRYGEMMLASQQVIAHRTARMLSASGIPNARDRREFARMHHEKAEAAALALFGMWAQLVDFNQRLYMRSLGPAGFIALTDALPRDAASRRRRRLAATRLVRDGNRLTGALAHAALKPIHAKATANARRLRGKRG